MNLPSLKSREEMLELLQQEEYGYLPPAAEVEVAGEEMLLKNFCAGKAVLKKVMLHCKISEGFTFPVYCTLPTDGEKHPYFVMINFRDPVPDRYLPVEELVDRGFAVLSFCYEDVTTDDRDFKNGLAGVLFPEGHRKDTDPGKIAMWAWAAQRVRDFAETLDCLDHSCCTVCGHSRLGKTALLAGATDERFTFVHSNDSGCSGAAITRGKRGEHIVNIATTFPFWFCKNYLKYINREEELPFDQHFLIASIAPRYVSVASAEQDIWADPVAEHAACMAASPAFEAQGVSGFIGEDQPQVGKVFYEGTIGYQLRAGTHYFSRTDWLKLMDFIEGKMNV